MNIEKDLFERSIIDTNKLLEYGFIKEEDILVYKKKILEESFLVVIEYRDYIKGKIIDLEFDCFMFLLLYLMFFSLLLHLFRL